MPFKSRAQRRKFAELLVKGDITPETFEEWNRETGSAKLPDHVRKPAKPRKNKTKKKAATKATRKAPRKTTAKRKKKSTR
jgi:hypothetical protein